MSITIHDKSPKTYIILGMHKGGTSFISKALHKIGIDMGDIDGRHYEDKNFLEFSKKILEKAGGDSMNPPTQKDIEKAVTENVDELKKLIKSKPFWGFKDPQSALTIKPMLPYFKDDVYLICVFRKPSKVADSLSRSKSHIKRYKMTREKSMKLTHNYYNNILSTIKSFLKT